MEAHALFGAQAALLQEINGACRACDQEQPDAEHVGRDVKHQQRTRHAERGLAALTHELRAHQKRERNRRDERAERRQAQALAQREVCAHGNQGREAEREMQRIDRAHMREKARRDDVNRV
ncbi:MAG: hypothetical protein WDO74_27310 [Pseudomonadota bacterium]